MIHPKAGSNYMMKLKDKKTKKTMGDISLKWDYPKAWIMIKQVNKFMSELSYVPGFDSSGGITWKHFHSKPKKKKKNSVK